MTDPDGPADDAVGGVAGLGGAAGSTGAQARTMRAWQVAELGEPGAALVGARLPVPRPEAGQLLLMWNRGRVKRLIACA